MSRPFEPLPQKVGTGNWLTLKVPVPEGLDAATFCQPHELDRYCDHLGVPGGQGEYGRAQRVQWNPEKGCSERGCLTTDPPHHHLWLELPEGYVMAADIQDKLARAALAGEAIPKPIWYNLPPTHHAVAAEALRFPGYEVCKSACGARSGIVAISDPVGKLGIRYCCYDCKLAHDDGRCRLVLSKLPDPTTRPQRLVLRVAQEQVPLDEPLIVADGTVITHKVVRREVLEDKALYLERLRQWYLGSGCWR